MFQKTLIALALLAVAGIAFLLAGCNRSEPAAPASAEVTQQPDHSAHSAQSPESPPAVAAQDEEDLYLTPGGKYTLADIAANEHQTAPQKFKGLRAAHDLKPQPGDKICPITLTKANPQFTWIVGGQAYEFCCPPCVDEFVRLAKESPEQIETPGAYVKN